MHPHPNISEFLTGRIGAGDFPSAVYLVWQQGRIRYEDALGHAVVGDDPFSAELDTVYDLASLTKVLVTGLLAALLVERGQWSLDDGLSVLFPETDLHDKKHVTLREMLTHTSGLPPWKPFYLLVEHRSEVADSILTTPLTGEKGVVYGDPNFILLGKMIEKAAQQALDSMFTETVAAPLGIAPWDVAFNPLEDVLLARIAASETGNGHERRVCEELGFLSGMPDEVADRYFRTDTIWGEVHDGNAYFMGGVAGHAGLFGTAAGVLNIAEQFLPSTTRLLKPDTCELFTTNFTPNADEHRSFAFQLASTPESTAGTLMSPQSFGHLGFTGTSLWIDPVKERIFILLTNRTHNHPLPFVNINSVRRRFHDLAIEALERDF